jgi:hypothetical protein
MLLDTTYSNKDHEQLINDLVGKPFSLYNAFKMKGVGSKRMIIGDVSPNLKFILNSVSDANYANLELRPAGIVVRINKGLKNYTWVIPYYQLVIYTTNGSSIHAQGKFIHFMDSKTLKENKPFFKKLLDEKIKHNSKYNFQYVL